MNSHERIRTLWHSLYPDEYQSTLPRLETLLVQFTNKHPGLRNKTFSLDERDSVLITYADQIQSGPGDRTALACLNDFLQRYIGDTISSLHLLPFFPYSSDDGFSVIDYTQVDPDVGDWEDINRLGENYHLMFDFVLNHISRASEWFQKFVQGDPHYQDYFITVDPATDLSSVVRPRALPLLTAVETNWGEKHIWTTFSDDQIDLNYANPEVALDMISVLLEYVEQGAEIIRMDAIAYLWKKIGTTSIHLPETHRFVKLLRAILDTVAPEVVLITETNVPHEENISYFGAPLSIQDTGGSTIRSDEAQMVYQFPLAPLVLHTFLHGDCTVLSHWAKDLESPVGANTFFNFIASHDGIGVRPAEGLLQTSDIQALIDRTFENGGQVSYKQNADGTKSPYELNITLYDFLNDPQNPKPDQDLKRFMASQAIMLSLAGVPGIYVHSLFGSSNCQRCLQESGRARSLNREKFAWRELQGLLNHGDTRAARILQAYLELLELRRSSSAFSPQADQRIIPLIPQLFCLLRTNQLRLEQILVLINIADQPAAIEIDLVSHNLPSYNEWKDIITGSRFPTTAGRLHIESSPSQVLWLQPIGSI